MSDTCHFDESFNAPYVVRGYGTERYYSVHEGL